jgi:hypothetical protein
MKVLIDVGHPADVHFFKNVAINLIENEHDIKITARSKDVLINLLEVYDFEYEEVGGYGKSIPKKVYEYVRKGYKLYRTIKRYNPDILLGFANPFVAQLGKILNKPSIVFTDTEHAILANILTFPFANVICAPSCFKKKINSTKHVVRLCENSYDITG